MSDRAVLVVGGSSGIGLATAITLGRDGDRVVLMARDREALEAAERTCRAAGVATVSSVVGDVAVESEVERAVGEASDRLGGLDGVVQTATMMGYGSVEQTPSDIFTAVVDAAVHGTLYVARAALSEFRRRGGGTLVVVNSLLGSITVPNMGAYATAKWGQRAIARTLQQELQGERGLNVCIVSPGSTNTPIYYQAANYTGRAARPPVPVLQPERAAAAIASLLDRPRKHVSIPVGPTNPVIVAGFRILPFLYDRLVGPLFRLLAQTRTNEPSNDGNVRVAHASDDRLFGRWPER